VKKKFFLWGLVLLFSFSTASYAHDFDTLKKVYTNVANKIISLSKGDSTDGAQFAALSKRLIKLAVPIMKFKVKQMPECGKMLNFVMSNRVSMQNLTHPQIEDKFHEGTSLPKGFPAKCLDSKELIVHPATVVILSRGTIDKKSKESMHDEIEEVLEHLGEL